MDANGSSATGRPAARNPNRPLVFGEILFDEFADGRIQLGGAPLNVAWHLRAFGLEPLLVSRVGSDDLGALLVDRLAAAGLDTHGVQRDTSYPTGRIAVELVDSAHPHFIAPADQAYDFIDPAAVPGLAAEGAGLIYHGSLAVRSSVSASALHALRETGLPVFIDVNLRPPWWNLTAVENLLIGARWLKLNASELLELGPSPVAGTLLQRAQALRARFALQAVIVTCGEQGSFAVTTDSAAAERPEPIARFVDSVGAGDAFSAVALIGIVRGWPLRLTLHRAAAFAAAICGVPGALPPDAAIYRRFLLQWQP